MLFILENFIQCISIILILTFKKKNLCYMWIGKKSLDAVLHFVSNLFIICISGVLCSRFFPFMVTF